jgi:myogenesis-regulating glycosidase
MYLIFHRYFISFIFCLDDKNLQTIRLGTEFGDQQITVVEIKDGWKIQTTENNGISFVVDVDTDKFASLHVKRTFLTNTGIATDCIHLNPDNLNWYGGPQQMDQRYPVQKFDNFVDYAYITKELESAAIMERYWFSSNGFFILVDYETPLFIDQNNPLIASNSLCFTAKKALPYNVHNVGFTFNYRIGAGVDPKETHLNVINRMLGKPRGMPDERLVKYPIWNSWVRYGKFY